MNNMSRNKITNYIYYIELTICYYLFTHRDICGVSQGSITMATDPGMADVVISPGPETFPVDTTPDEQVKPPYNRGFLRSSYNWVKLTEIVSLWKKMWLHR